MLSKTPAKNIYISNPSIAKEWHPTKNGNLTLKDVTLHSNRKVWWLCSKDHVWSATINERIHGNDCPYCSEKVKDENITQEINQSSSEEIPPATNESLVQESAVCAEKKVDIENDQQLNPSLVKEWHPTKNEKLKVWWLCSNGHEWLATVSERIHGNGCPHCAEEVEYEKIRQSAEPSQKEEVHSTNNESLKLREVTVQSKRKVIPENCLLSVNPNLAKEWHPTKNGSLTPADVTASSYNQVWWLCSKGHEWKAAISNRNKGQGCFYCSYMHRRKH
jgi:hypothetical protein